MRFVWRLRGMHGMDPSRVACLGRWLDRMSEPIARTAAAGVMLNLVPGGNTIPELTDPPSECRKLRGWWTPPRKCRVRHQRRGSRWCSRFAELGKASHVDSIADRPGACRSKQTPASFA
jgi:hypothetical protein